MSAVMVETQANYSLLSHTNCTGTQGCLIGGYKVVKQILPFLEVSDFSR